MDRSSIDKATIEQGSFDGNDYSQSTRDHCLRILRLITINYPGSGNSTSFTYDGFGNRVKIVESGTVNSTQQFIFAQGLREVRDATGINVLSAFYRYGEILSGSVYFVTRDQVNSTRELSDGRGNLVANYAYDPYGRMIQLQGSIVAQFLFQGYYFHGRSSLFFAHYRQYDASIGRWLSRDPSTIAGSLNYVFVSGDPVSGMDPSGLKETKASGAKQLGNLLAGMDQLCDCDCINKDRMADCKTDAKTIVTNLVNFWNNHYGKGPYSDTAEGSDSVGGYLCWDWASGFVGVVNQAHSSVWEAFFRRFNAPTNEDGMIPVHYVTRIYMKDSKDFQRCQVTIDDGFFEDGMVHPPGWPSRKDYKESPHDIVPQDPLL